MVVLVTGNMGAQTEGTAQTKLPQLTNSERCIICYEAHTVTESETGISFELRNLKDIFVRCFGIQFLPHFSEFGRVHMCTRCNEEYSKVEKLYDAVKCTENSFDAAREKLAFLVVDSILKSGYISNYVHGNAFDAIRCLVFKAWSTKFKKQGQSKKGNNNNNNNNGNNSENLDGNSLSEITATEDTAAGVVKNSTDETKSPPDKTITEEDEKISPPLSKITPQKNKSVQKKASTEPKTTRTSEKAGDTDQPPVQEAKVTEGKAQSPSHQLVTSSVDPECEKNSEGPPVLVKQVEDRNEENQSASISSTNITKESSKSTQGEKKTNNKTTSEPAPASASAKAKPAEEEEDLVRKSSIPSLPAEKKQADAPPPLRASIPKAGQPTYILSPDGKKLMSNTGGVLQNTRLIFVKKDPLTGKMIQVPRPNLGSVKGKLNGKDVIVRTAPSSAPNRVHIRPLGVTSADSLSDSITKMIPGSKVSMSSISVTVAPASTDSPPVPKIVSVQSMQNRPQNKPVVPASSPPKLQPAVKQKNDPAAKQKNELTVKQKAEPAVKQKNEPAAKQKSEPAVKQKNEPDTKSNEDNKGPQSKQQPQQQPTLTEESPEQRSSRSGRRIKRPFESSDWASGHEMNKLLSHSIKVGRHQLHSPSKRQKSDVVKPSSTIITSELLDTSDQPEEEEAVQE